MLLRRRRSFSVALAVAAAILGAGWAPVGVAWAAASRDPCPTRYVIGAVEDEGDGSTELSQDLRANRGGRFSIVGRPAVRLAAPVDWKQDPYDSETWRSKLHSFQWLEPLLELHGRTRSRTVLVQARDLVLDWVRQNPAPRGFGWADKISGERAEVLAYVLAAGQCARILTAEQRGALRTAAVDHGRYLTDPDNYNPGNHGLFQDRGIITLASRLPSLPQAAGWRRAAIARFRGRLPIHPQEAVTLEHSPGYHQLVLNLVENVLAIPGAGDRLLRAKASRMRSVLGWFVTPSGILTRLGDTAVKPAPGWARSRAARLRGIAPTRRSGFGIAKLGSSYLAVAAGYHPFGHKQADELTFELYDRGRPIVTDTGRYGAARNRRDEAKAAALAYTKSSSAHSVLLVDGKPFQARGHRPYGSAISATGSGGGWWAIEGRNPLVTRQGVRHNRLFLFRPGRALVVVDRISAKGSHTYTRQFHLDPRVRATGTGDGRAALLRSGPFNGALTSTGSAQPEIVMGRRDPLLGFTTSADKFGALIPRPVVSFNNRASSTTMAATISMRGRGSTSVVRSTPTQVVVRLTGAGGPPTRITVSRRGVRLVASAGRG